MIDSIKRTASFIKEHPLAKRHLFSAYLKAFSWQVRTLFTNKPVALKFIEPTKFIAQKGLTGITGNIYVGLHEFEDMGFLLHFLKEDDVFFDVGANVGSYTLLASGVKRAKTIAFEPIPKTHSFLVKNIALNGLQNLVLCERKGVGKKEETLHFIDDVDTMNHVVRESGKKSIVVDSLPLDKFYPEYKPSLIKIDVEGFETEVISGATKILSDPTLKAIIIELNGSGERYGYDDKNIHNTLIAADFEPYTYNPFKRELTKINSFGNFNTIYLRDLKVVNERLTSSAPFTVFNEMI